MNKNIFWKTISVLLSPLLAPLYFVVLYYLYTPELVYMYEVVLVGAGVVISTFLLPFLLIFILKKLKRVDSMELATKDERRLPVLIAVVLLYVVNYKLLPYVSRGVMVVLIGMQVSLIATYISLWWTKISVHAMGVASVLMGVFLLFLKWGYPLVVVLPVLIGLFLAYDLVVMARMEMKAHTAMQVMVGTVVGVGIQLLAFYLLPY